MLGDDVDTVIDKATRRYLDNNLSDFEELLDAINTSELHEHVRTKTLFKNAWNTLRPLVDSMILAPASNLVNGSVDDGTPTPTQKSFDSAIWILDFIWRWQLATKHSVSIKAEFEEWRNDIIEDMEFAFRDANRIKEGQDEASLLAHLVRINKILTSVGSDMDPWISAGSKNFLRITQSIFEQGLDVDKDARPIIGAYIANVRAEMRQMMSWKNPELEELVEKANAYGF
jgi:hypothetical protein